MRDEAESTMNCIKILNSNRTHNFKIDSFILD